MYTPKFVLVLAVRLWGTNINIIHTYTYIRVYIHFLTATSMCKIYVNVLGCLMSDNRMNVHPILLILLLACSMHYVCVIY